MKPPEVYRFKTSAELAEAAARQWLALLTKPPSAPQGVALLGGRIAGPLFAAFARRVSQQKASLAHAHFFWADERCVPPSSPDSNFALAERSLFRPLGMPPSQYHRVPGEEPPPRAAQLATDELRRIAPLNEQGQPVLDLVLLGMGEDGHVASLFPGESEGQIRDPAVYRPVTAVKPPPQRITLGYATLAAAREVWVLVAGAGKAEALSRALEGDVSLPLGRLLAMRSHTVVYTDSNL
jgi:6-phosphogluconolactonase